MAFTARHRPDVMQNFGGLTGLEVLHHKPHQLAIETSFFCVMPFHFLSMVMTHLLQAVSKFWKRCESLGNNT